MNLFQFADMLIKRGVVNAVNLDGGGSSLLMEGDTILNYPGVINLLMIKVIIIDYYNN